MKKCISWVGVMAILALAVCSIWPRTAETDFSNMVLTGEVLCSENGTVTLNLGELTGNLTPESISGIRFPVVIPSFVHAAPDTSTAETAVQAFISWKRDAVLDLNKAAVYSVSEDGEQLPGSVDDIAPQNLIFVTVDDTNRPATVFILQNTEKICLDSESVQGSAANTITEDLSERGTEYTSTGDDENALRVVGAKATLRHSEVEKQSGSSSDSFRSGRYGLNAALLATDGAHLSLINGIVNASVDGSTGLFGYGAGTRINLNGGAITTTGDGGTGVQASGGAQIQVQDLTAITAGNSASVICTARDGRVDADDGMFTSGGYDSPAVYAMGDVTMSHAELTANNSQALVLEDSPEVILRNCTVSGNMQTEEATTETGQTIQLYSSRSDSSQDSAVLRMLGGSLASKSGNLFNATNTRCEILLNQVNIENSGSDVLLCATGNNGIYGTAGENGADVTLRAQKQQLNGRILVDDISSLHFILEQGSSFSGMIQKTAFEGSTAPNGEITVKIAKGSTWSLTGNSTVDILQNEGTIVWNGYTITLADGTVLSA